MSLYQVDFADTEELNRQYRIAASVPHAVFAATTERYRTLTADAVRELPTTLDVCYDPQSGMRLDIFHGAGTGTRPVLLFIHGGYWRMLSKADSGFMAKSFTAEGISVVAVDYALAPAVTLEEIVRQVRAAIAWIHRSGAAHGLDANRLHVSGSSAGGHLTAMAAADGWQAEFGVPADIVKSAFPISGLFDLRPLPRSFTNEWLQLDPPRAAALSPLLHLPRAACKVHLFWGADETAAFANQSLLYCETLRSGGILATATEVLGRHHFDVVLDLADPGSLLARCCFDVIGEVHHG